MKYLAKLTLVCFMAMGLMACASNRDAGVVTGAIVGGILGHQVGGGSGRVVATAIGAVAGSMIGGAIGSDMDKHDKARMQHAIEHSPTGKHTVWVNPDSGYEYDVVNKRTYYHDSQPCREYITKATIGGKTRQIYGKACRMDDGSWKVVN